MNRFQDSEKDIWIHIHLHEDETIQDIQPVNGGESMIKVAMYSTDGRTLLYDGYWYKKSFRGYGLLYEQAYIYHCNESSARTNKVLIQNTGISLYKGNFLNGLKEGFGEEFDSEGRLIYKGNFQNGVHCGEGTEFYSNGKIKFEGTFNQKGQLDGPLCRFYSFTGLLLYEGAYNNGSQVNSGNKYIATTYCVKQLNNTQSLWYHHVKNCTLEIVNYGDCNEYEYDKEVHDMREFDTLPYCLTLPVAYICKIWEGR